MFFGQLQKLPLRRAPYNNYPPVVTRNGMQSEPIQIASSFAGSGFSTEDSPSVLVLPIGWKTPDLDEKCFEGDEQLEGADRNYSSSISPVQSFSPQAND